MSPFDPREFLLLVPEMVLATCGSRARGLWRPRSESAFQVKGLILAQNERWRRG